MKTHHVICTFGKFAGQLVTRIPVGYLQWAVNNKIDDAVNTEDGVSSFHEVAKAEIERRGERIKDIDVSAHAIDRMSTKHLKVWRDNRMRDEGLFTFMQRVGLEAWKNRWTLQHERQEGGHWKVLHLGIEWLFEELVIPVVKTIA